MIPSSFASSNIQPVEPFVKLSNIIPTIIQSPRYTHNDNFLGRPVPGYHSTDFICTRQAALALKKVNDELNHKGYTLVVYDAYRPQKAVDAFVQWGKTDGHLEGQAYYYPTIAKQNLFSLGYLAEKSSHSRGSTFDLSIIPIHQPLKPITVRSHTLTNGEVIPFLDDNTVDMGSSFDLFHPVSHQDSTLITAAQTGMRALLRNTMRHHGFQELHEEWWHYTLINEPYPYTYFDF